MPDLLYVFISARCPMPVRVRVRVFVFMCRTWNNTTLHVCSICSISPANIVIIRVTVCRFILLFVRLLLGLLKYSYRRCIDIRNIIFNKRAGIYDFVFLEMVGGLFFFV